MTVVRTPQLSEGGGKRLEVSTQRGVYTALGYRSVTVANREGRSYPTGSADSFLDYDREHLIAQSRDFDRNNAIYRGIVNRAVSYILGRGFGLRVLSLKAEDNEAIEAAWKRWYKGIDIRGLISGRRLSAMVCREAILCGDIGLIKRDNSKVQIIESEQITTGRGSGTGIEVNADGIPTRYHVCPYNSRGQISPTNHREIDAKNFIFWTTPNRPSQTRGEPVLQPSFPMLHRINDICDSEALARQLLSRLVMTVTREAGDQRSIAESVVDPNKPNAAAEGDVAARLTELPYAVIYHGAQGDKVAGIDRNIPGDNFEDVLRSFLRLTGLAIGLPLELVMLDWSKANYSQSRAILEQAYQTFCEWQDGAEDHHYQPMFEWQLPALLKAAGVSPGDEPIVTEWIRPSFPWIDQLKEAQAHGVKIDRCLTTHAHVLKELGLDREQMVVSRQREIVDAITRAKEVKAETGVDVAWQTFAGLQSPQAETPAGIRDKTDRDENIDKDEDEDKDKPSDDEESDDE